MADIDHGPVTLPNGTTITRDDRKTGRVYLVNGDPDVRDALPSVTNVLKVLPAEALENWKLRVGVDDMVKALRDEFYQQYQSQPGTAPSDAKAFTSLFAQAREWARQGHVANDIEDACRALNAEQFRSPLDDDMLSSLLTSAVKSGQEQSYDSFIGETLEGLACRAKSGNNKINEEATEIGGKVHEVIEKELLGEPVPEPLLKDERLALAISAWHEWRDKVGFAEVIAVEQPLYHPDGFAGTIDAIVRLSSGAVAMLDWKTSTRFYPKYALQIAAYARGWEYVSAQRTTESYVIRFDKKLGKPVPSEPIVLPRAWQSFEAALRFHQATERLHLVWQGPGDFN